MSMRRGNSQYFSPEKQVHLKTGDTEVGEEGLNGLLKRCAVHFSMLFMCIKIHLWSQRVIYFVRDL